MRRVIGAVATQYIEPDQPHVDVLESNSKGVVMEEERRRELGVRIREQRCAVVIVSVRAIRGPSASGAALKSNASTLAAASSNRQGRFCSQERDFMCGNT